MDPTVTFQQIKKALETHNYARQGKPNWERTQREAAAYFQTIGLPTQKTEAYKYTSIHKCLAENFDFSIAATHQNPSFSAVLNPFIKNLLQEAIPSYSLILVNGCLDHHYTLPSSVTGSYQATSFTELQAYHKKLLEAHYQQYIPQNQDPFSILNMALFNDGLYIYIPDGTILDKPLWLYHITDNITEQTISYPRVFIWVGEDSQVDVVHSCHKTGEKKAFTNAVTEIIVGKRSKVAYYTLQLDKQQPICQINTTSVYQAADSLLHTYTITNEGRWVRNNLYIALQEPHCQANLYGLYSIRDNQHVDNQTTVDHQQVATSSNEVYKGILAENSTGVFNGKIYVRRIAQQTNALQRNNNILLSPEATVHTKPQLEIWADDVKCTHGATVGQLDPEQLFYLRARGISQSQAQKMLLNAFCNEIIAPIGATSIKKFLQDKLIAHLHELS